MVRNRWKLLLKVPDLPFTQMYQAFDLVTKQNVSLKVESVHQQIQRLEMEVTVLRRLQGEDHIHKFLGGGTNELYNYVVTTFQGEYSGI
jgi:serine/threonine protein kinase